MDSETLTGDGTAKRRQSTRFFKGLGTTATKPPNFEGSEGLVGLFAHPLTLLLICLPVGIWSHYAQWGSLITFWLIFFAMIPLAKILGDLTEELAASLKNDILAGLINATFGNAVEMVITVQTLRGGLYDVVKATLLGSVLSNVLLVLGMSFLLGGLVNLSSSRNLKEPASDKFTYSIVANEKVQTFRVLGAMVNTSMLLLSCLSFSMVTVFKSLLEDEPRSVIQETMLPISRTCSLIIASTYVAYILFQLVTHRSAMGEEEGGDGEHEESNLSSKTSIALLCVFTAIVAYSTDILVHAMKGLTADSKMGKHFIGMILLPIVGNACEHAAAVRFSMQDKPGLSIGIAIGSSTQIALFVVPFSVLCGWALDRPMDLDFGALNVTVMTLSVIVVLSMVVDGQSNWLQGYLLCAAYAVVAVLFWHLPDAAQ